MIFIIKLYGRDGKEHSCLIEVKPDEQTEHLDEFGEPVYPNPPKKQNKRSMFNWQTRCSIIKKNHDKWLAARRFAAENNYTFKIITENELFTNLK